MKMYLKHSGFVCRYVLYGLFGFCCMWITACSDEDDTTSTTGIKGMSGTINSTIPDYFVKDSTILLTANGITNPASEELSYQWTIASPDSTCSVWGQVIKYKCPDASTMTVTITSDASGFYSSSIKKGVALINKTYAETVQGIYTGTVFTDDRDGQEYQFEHIGSYDWMTQNLNWAGAGKNYKNQYGYNIIFGRLYSWDDAVRTTDPVCPNGWRVPTNTEWEDLGTALNDGAPVSFDAHWPDLGSKAAVNATVNGKAIWPYDPTPKTNTVGWNALPGGKGSDGDIFNDVKQYGYWWSATAYNATEGCYRYIIYNYAPFYFNYGDKDGLFLSVRCVR